MLSKVYVDKVYKKATGLNYKYWIQIYKHIFIVSFFRSERKF